MHALWFRFGCVSLLKDIVKSDVSGRDDIEVRNLCHINRSCYVPQGERTAGGYSVCGGELS